MPNFMTNPPMYQYQPMMNPNYNPAMNQMYSQPMNPIQNQVSGPTTKIIDSENDITVNEIPMDGQPHLFILKDFSRIIGKMWTTDGKIATSIYVIDQQKPVDQTNNEDTRSWMTKQFKELKDLILDKATSPAGQNGK